MLDMHTHVLTRIQILHVHTKTLDMRTHVLTCTQTQHPALCVGRVASGAAAENGPRCAAKLQKLDPASQ